MKEYKFTDEELNDYTEMFVDILENVCIFADKHNFDRDSIFKYLADQLLYASEITTLANYELGE